MPWAVVDEGWADCWGGPAASRVQRMYSVEGENWMEISLHIGRPLLSKVVQKKTDRPKGRKIEGI